MQTIHVKIEAGEILATLHIPDGEVRIRETHGVEVETHPKIEAFEVSRAWEVSISHIKEIDAEALEMLVEESPHLIVHQYREGFWLAVPDDTDWATIEDECYFGNSGFSVAIPHILSIARGHKFQYVHLDADAPLYEFLPEYHW